MPALLPKARRPRLLALALTLAAIPACSSSGPADSGPPEEPSEPLGELVGTWEATSMVLTARSDPDVSLDLVQDPGVNGRFTLVIRSDGSYRATLTAFGQESPPETGTVTRSGDSLRFDPDGGPEDAVAWSLSDGVLVLDGESTFDFNDDGTDEEARLHVELVRA